MINSFDINFHEQLIFQEQVYKNIENETKKFLNLYYSQKDQQLKIWQHFPNQVKKNEEIIHIDNIMNFLVQSNYNFFMHQ